MEVEGKKQEAISQQGVRLIPVYGAANILNVSVDSLMRGKARQQIVKPKTPQFLAEGHRLTTSAYIDGSVIKRMDNLLHDGKPTALDLYNVESFVEAAVLNDELVAGFNLIVPGTIEQRRVEDFLAEKKILFRSESDFFVSKGYRILMPSHTMFYEGYRNDVADTIVEFGKISEKHIARRTTNVVDEMDAYRKFLSNRLKRYSHSIRGATEDITGLIRTARINKMDLVLMPEWSPFTIADVPALSFAVCLYRELSKLHKIKLEKLYAISKPRSYYIPPLLSIVLSKCRGRDDFMENVWTLREDLTPFREASRKLQYRIAGESQLRDQLDALEEYTDAVAALARKVKSPKPRLLQAMWDLTKEGTLGSIILKGIDRLYERDMESRCLGKIEGFYDLWNSSLRVKNYFGQFERVFGPLDETEKNSRMHAASRHLAELMKMLTDVAATTPQAD